jgi:hypothetical protein
LDARGARHFLVGEDDVDAVVGEERLSSFGAVGSVDLEIVGQKGRKRGEQIRLVIHQQQGTFLCAQAQAPWTQTPVMQET